MNKVRIEDKAPKNARKIIFKTMEEGDGLYRISEEGHVMSLKGSKKILKHIRKNNKHNSYYVRIFSNGKKETHFISTLIKKYFP